jgi:hypothetical protein
MPEARTWEDVEAEIGRAVSAGILVDKRAVMPRGVLNGTHLEWGTRSVVDILGLCVHQSASPNQNPIRTAEYHTSKGNHITPGRPLPGLAYTIAITDKDEPAWLCTDIKSKTWSQGSSRPGDENRHLIGIVVMGSFNGAGWHGKSAGPTDKQMAKLLDACEWLGETFGFGGEGYFGHYHCGKAACPGTVIQDWIESKRASDDKASFASDMEWQLALLRWNEHALPRFGADGSWGRESREWLTQFQKAMNIGVTGVQDPFTQLVLLQRYPAP